MRGGQIPDDLLDDVRTTEILDLWGGTPSMWDEEDKHEIDRLLAIKRAIGRWRVQEAKSARLGKK